MQTDIGLIIAIVGSAVGIIAITVGSTIALFLWNRAEASADRRDIVNLIIAIKEDMKDFHTQLQLQDKEFKMRLCAIEEKRNK